MEIEEQWYIVEVPEIHYALTKVKAVSPEKAIEKVSYGEGDILSTEYGHTDESKKIEDWDVRLFS